MRTSTCTLTLWVFVTALGLSTSAMRAAEPTVSWLRQWGTSEWDEPHGLLADGLGGIYITGRTWGSLGGPNAGGSDAFLSKYDESGTHLWTQQWGTSEHEGWENDVSLDGVGNIYVAGSTGGSLGGANLGDSDAFLSKFDTSGTLLWTQQWGTEATDYVRGVSADGLGNVYITGRTEGSLGGPNAGESDAFLSKYDTSGTLLWTQQWGTADGDGGRGVFADDVGNVYVAGGMRTVDYAPDAFISKFDASGALLWSQEWATPYYESYLDLTVDGQGNVYAVGNTCLAGEDNWDAIFSKYDESGTLLWTQQSRTPFPVWEVLSELSGDGQGNFYVTRFDSKHGLSKFDASGTLLWSQEWDFEVGLVSADGLGNVYIANQTDDGRDIYLAKITEILAGDFDDNGELNAADIDLLSTAVRDGPYDPGFDLNLDTLLDKEDRRIWVEDIFGTFFGDASLNQEVQFEDLVALANAFGGEGGWAMGDFDGDSIVQFPDLVLLADNFGKSAMRAPLVQIPEPSGFLLAFTVGLVLMRVGAVPWHRE